MSENTMKKTSSKKPLIVLIIVVCIAVLLGAGALVINNMFAVDPDTLADPVNNSGPARICMIDDRLYYTSMNGLSAIDSDMSGESAIIDEDIYGSEAVAQDGVIYFKKTTCFIDKQPVNVLFSYDVESGTVTELAAVPFVNRRIDQFCVYGNTLYYILNTYTPGGNAYSSVYEIYAVNLRSGKTSLKYTLPENQYLLSGSRLCAYNGSLYYLVLDTSSEKTSLVELSMKSFTANEPFVWPGSSMDSFAISGNRAIIATVNTGIISYDIDARKAETLLQEKGIHEMYLNGSTIAYSHHETYAMQGSTHLVYTHGVYIHDIETGSTTQIFDSFCKIEGVVGDRVYFYDQSNLEDPHDNDTAIMPECMSSMKFDGSGLVVLPSKQVVPPARHWHAYGYTNC